MLFRSYIPMDETLSRCAIDFSNRPYLIWKVEFRTPKVGDMDTELFKEFHHAFAMNAGACVHLDLLRGTNSHHIAGDLHTSVQKLKDATPAGVLLGSGKLATDLDLLDLIDEYKFLVHPRIAGHGPTLHHSGLRGTRRLELVSARPLRCGAVRSEEHTSELQSH